ncbi:MAG: hypothetical protein ACJ0DF_08220 [Paracoccaceae bacterium]
MSTRASRSDGGGTGASNTNAISSWTGLEADWLLLVQQSSYNCSFMEWFMLDFKNRNGALTAHAGAAGWNICFRNY